ncbi:hypothetical protein BJ742DRAFT_769514 [Cladochytrium replicatum]|nr:hypothetical protein BJ742DRAFT_769514 [Cladochytrium replicatum]
MHAMMENIVGTMEAGTGKVFASPGMRTKGEQKKVLGEAERVAANPSSKMYHFERSSAAGDEALPGIHSGGQHNDANVADKNATPAMAPSSESTGRGL